MLFINEGVVQLSPQLEEELLRAVNRQRDVLMRDHTGKPAAQRREAVEITERRLIVGAHNTWDFVNHNGGKNFISLSAPDPRTHVCRLAGVLKVENVVMDEQVALIFKLEYTLAIRGEEKTSFTCVLGWFIHIPHSTR